MRCRHDRNSWIIGGYWEWCYRCWAIRRLTPIAPNGCTPASGWLRPVGPDAPNPGELPELRKLSAIQRAQGRG